MTTTAQPLLQYTYCSRNKCYTPTEFALFGIGASLVGIILGILFISWSQQCLARKEWEDEVKVKGTARQDICLDRSLDSTSTNDLDQLSHSRVKLTE